jgi:hypothetical protein
MLLKDSTVSKPKASYSGSALTQPEAYSFLDPKKQGGLLAAYIVGIAAAGVIIFAIVWGICWVRNRIWRKHEMEKYDSVPMQETKA